MLDEYGNYGTNITDLGEDIYAGVLSIRDMKEEDYGEYTCRASNQVGDDKKTIIRLVRKGKEIFYFALNQKHLFCLKYFNYTKESRKKKYLLFP